MAIELGGQIIETNGSNLFPTLPSTGVAPTANRAIYKSVMFTLFGSTQLLENEGIGIVRNAVLASGTVWSESLYRELINVGKTAKSTIPGINPNNFLDATAYKTGIQVYLDNDPAYAAAFYNKMLSIYLAGDYSEFQDKWSEYHPS